MLGIVFSPENILTALGDGADDGSTPPVESSMFLLEDDGFLLLEDGDKILLQR